MVMTWEYHAKQSNSDGNSHEPYDFTRIWDIQQKARNEQIRQRKAHRHRQQFRGYQKERVEGAVEKGKGGQTYGDGRFDLGW